MRERFCIDDLLDTLIRLERNGFDFYSRYAQKTTIPGVKDLFTLLAREENRHETLYRDLKKSVQESGALNDAELDPEYERYLDGLVRQSFGFKGFEPLDGDSKKGDDPWEQAIDFAIQLEKDTLLYIGELQSILRTESPAVFEEVKKEEKRHLTMLTDYKREMTL